MQPTTYVAAIVAGVVTSLFDSHGDARRDPPAEATVLSRAGPGRHRLGRAVNGVPPLFAVSDDLEISVRADPLCLLPTLTFEAAFNLDARQLRENLGSILILAGPGLLLSTLVIGLVVSTTTPIPFTAALLLGAILSATDPVAVVALFGRLGAPHRLRVLVEGESLFNDATSIVLARLLLGVVLAGTVSDRVIAQGALDFVWMFVGDSE